MNKPRLGLIAVLLLMAVNAKAVIIGETLTGANSHPFGGTGGTWYQQVYDASLFSDDLDIFSLTFYNTNFDTGAWTNDALYNVYLSTTDQSSTTLFGAHEGNWGLTTH